MALIICYLGSERLGYLYLYTHKAGLIKSPTVYVFTTEFEILNLKFEMSKAKFVSGPVIEEWHHSFTFLVHPCLPFLCQFSILLICLHAALPLFSLSLPSFLHPISRTLMTQPSWDIGLLFSSLEDAFHQSYEFHHFDVLPSSVQR